MKKTKKEISKVMSTLGKRSQKGITKEERSRRAKLGWKNRKNKAKKKAK